MSLLQNRGSDILTIIHNFLKNTILERNDGLTQMGGIVGRIKRKVSQVVDFQHSCETFCGAEGTRTLDLRRDRPAF